MGRCQNVTYTATEPCSRSTDGPTSDETQLGAWGACVSDHATRSNTGYPDYAGCARNTLGTTCGESTYTGRHAVAHTHRLPLQRRGHVRVEPAHRKPGLRAEHHRHELRPAAEATCSYANECATMGTLSRKTTAYTCSSGGCEANTTQQLPGGCTRSTEGQSCDGSWLNNACRSGSCSYCDGAGVGQRVRCCERNRCVTAREECH